MILSPASLGNGVNILAVYIEYRFPECKIQAPEYCNSEFFCPFLLHKAYSVLWKEDSSKMMPIGPLMTEHRLIERMIALMKRELQEAEKEKRVNARFVKTATHFIRVYADRCHHGKEEDILFRELKMKSVSEEHKEISNELVEEHKRGRETTVKLVNANGRYEQGDKEALTDIVECIGLLVDFYPKHIEKEDKHFFIPVMDYFSGHEKEAMLKEGYEFDSRLIHQEYDDMVSTLEESMKGKL